MYDILLNCFPPYNLRSPIPSLSVLKRFLQENNIKTHVRYWNIEFVNIYSKYLDLSNAKDEAFISPILSINFEDDTDMLSKNISLLYCYRKNSHLSISQFTEAYHELVEEVKKYLLTELKKESLKNIKLFGFSFKYNQWIAGLVVSDILKKIYPELKIVIGGIDEIETASFIMKNFNNFDFAIWGEGEFPLVELYQKIITESYTLSDVPQLVYRSSNKINSNNRSPGKYFNNYLFPDYDDYFEQLKKNHIKPHDIELPINAVRGCNWNKCKFCVSRKGAKYQEREPDSVVNEIKQLLTKYRITNFIFVDNCSYKNTSSFYQLCDKLIELNSTFNEYLKIGITINHSGINRELVDKIYLAGIRRIQAGFESFSENQLSLMRKENNLADNILFAKLTLKYNISLPLLVITNLENEQITDILTSINNLHFFRFFLNNCNLNLAYSPLRIQKGSAFYHDLSAEELTAYDKNETAYLLPKNIQSLDTDKILFSYRKNTQNGEEWDKFNTVLNFYKNNDYTYKIIHTNGVCYFIEYLNGKETNTLIMDDPLYYEILRLTEDNIWSIELLIKQLSKTKIAFSNERVLTALNELKEEYIIYFDKDMSHIVSTIFVD